MWEYNRFSNDAFLFVLRSGVKVGKLDEHPAVIAMQLALGFIRKADARKTGFPSGAARYPRAWRGIYTLEDGIKFKIPALYAYPSSLAW